MPLGWKLLGAIAVWIIGGIVVRGIRTAFGAVSEREESGRDARQLSRYERQRAHEGAAARRGAERLGIETTSFAALLAALGVAIGAAWAGLLSNFAAGMFLMVLRPFKVGDMITAGGVTGDVREIGIFATAIDTADNIRVFVGNNKLFSDSIQNYSTNPFRRVDLTAQLAHGVDPKDAIGRLRDRLARIPNVVMSPAPSVEILTFTALGPVLAVRPFCHNSNYWQVYFDANQAIVQVGGEAHYPTPSALYMVKGLPA